MKLLLVSPYHGGSHQAWAEGFQRFSRHQVQLLTLPARYWKWRMHGGAVTLARRFKQEMAEPDLILATDMLDLTTFLALTRLGPIPAFLYLHENQLTYPLPEDGTSGPMRRQLGERDRHYAFINYTSMLAADRVFFNSEFHRGSFFEALRPFLKHFPDCNELAGLKELQDKSGVLPVGVDLTRLEEDGRGGPLRTEREGLGQPPLLLWNQRWEYDKNPGHFFEVVCRLAEEGVPFRLAVCGQNFRRRPEEFEEARQRLGDRIVHWGFAPESIYRKLLWQADLTVSTAEHEFFGISVVEAMYCQVFPLLPNALSYPELIPISLRERCLYSDRPDLAGRLRWALQHPDKIRQLATRLRQSAQRFDWIQLAPEYDRLFRIEAQTARSACCPPRG